MKIKVQRSEFFGGARPSAVCGGGLPDKPYEAS